MKQEEAKRFTYYKTVHDENIAEMSKRVLGSESYSQQIKELNAGKYDANGTIPKDTEILLPFNPKK